MNDVKNGQKDALKREEMLVDGMTCVNCAQTVNKYLRNRGLENVHVDFSSGRVSYVTKDDVGKTEIEAGINGLGYKVLKENQVSGTYKSIRNKFIISLIFTIPLFFSMFLPFHWLHNPYVQLILCLPVYALGMYHFGRSAWGSLKVGVPNMDVLITMGATAAFGYSLTGTLLQLGPDFMFYETAATIITLVLLGNLLEKRSVKQTTTAIDELGKLQSKTARRIVEHDGNEIIEEVNTDDVAPDDILLVNTGDSIPLDGVVTSGIAQVNESMITGESLPLEKRKDVEVIGGTLVEDGNIKMRVTATGEATVLSRIIEMVRDAQSSKPDIQRLGDRVSAIFVPVVLGIALITFVLSHFIFDIALGAALLRAVAVLVISCPCAMGLATPTAVMVGIGRAARKGILIRGGHTLEQFANIRNAVFDKTGTLTTGNFRIRDLEVYGNASVDEVRSMIYEIEKHSSHPIARSIVSQLGDVKPLVKLTDVQEEKGVGMSARLNGDTYQLGSAKLVDNGSDHPRHHLYLLKNSEIIAGVDIEDELVPEAKTVIDYFNQSGINTVLLSGDRQEKTASIAGQLGIRKYYAEKLPDEKLKIISALSSSAPTSMTGDGINDAPSLSKADVGVSLGHATQIAIQSAEVILLNGKLGTLPMAHKLSKATLVTIKQNLFWAFFYNVIAIPLAALGFLNPMIAALAMAFSDVMVIGNSLRLKLRKV